MCTHTHEMFHRGCSSPLVLSKGQLNWASIWWRVWWPIPLPWQRHQHSSPGVWLGTVHTWQGSWAGVGAEFEIKTAMPFTLVPQNEIDVNLTKCAQDH